MSGGGFRKTSVPLLKGDRYSWQLPLLLPALSLQVTGGAIAVIWPLKRQG